MVDMSSPDSIDPMIRFITDFGAMGLFAYVIYRKLDRIETIIVDYFRATKPAIQSLEHS